MIKKKLQLLLILIFVTLGFNVKSQVYTGGTMGVNYNDGVVVELAPILGYKYKIFEAGVSPLFSYAERQNKFAAGARLFTIVTVYKDTFVHAEFEAANVQKGEDIKSREWVLALPIGGGYQYEISKGVYAYGMILYNVIQKENSLTKNPIIRGGIKYQL